MADTKLQPKEVIMFPCYRQSKTLALQVAALITAVHWVVHGGARDALEYQVEEGKINIDPSVRFWVMNFSS